MNFQRPKINTWVDRRPACGECWHACNLMVHLGTVPVHKAAHLGFVLLPYRSATTNETGDDEDGPRGSPGERGMSQRLEFVSQLSANRQNNIVKVDFWSQRSVMLSAGSQMRQVERVTYFLKLGVEQLDRNPASV